MQIIVNHQNSILINNEIYVDPLKINDKGYAKYIFITHPHWDHFSVADIKKVLTNHTQIICPKTMQNEILNLFPNDIVFVEPNKSYNLDGVAFDTFPSYNTNKKYHPKDNQWLGYLLTIDNEKVAIIGDSDLTPELLTIKTDVLLVPIGGDYTMTLQDAAKLTNLIKPKKVIPTHYGEIVGHQNMGNEFKALINKCIDCEIQL